MDGFDTKNAALLVIDMQHASLDPMGSLVKLLGVKENRMLRTIAPIQQLLAAFRAAGRPVFYNQMAVSAEYSDAGLLGRVFFPLKGLGHCVDDARKTEQRRAGLQPKRTLCRAELVCQHTAVHQPPRDPPRLDMADAIECHAAPQNHRPGFHANTLGRQI